MCVGAVGSIRTEAQTLPTASLLSFENKGIILESFLNIGTAQKWKKCTVPALGGNTLQEVIYSLSHRIEDNALYTSTEKFAFLGWFFAKKLLQKRKIGTLTKVSYEFSCNMM